MNGKESSADIALWAEETFGPVKDLGDLVRRAGEELRELQGAISESESFDNISLEAADVTILLHRIVSLCGNDLDESVDRKMQINRSRLWAPSGDGTGQHL